MRSPCCLCVCESHLLTFECLNRSLWNLVCTSISWHLSSSQSVCMSVCVALLSLVGKGLIKYIPFIAGQRLGKHVPAATNTRKNTRVVRRVFRGLCIPLSFLGNNSLKTFPRQRWIGGVVFYAVRVVSYESRQLVLPRSYCFLRIWAHSFWCIAHGKFVMLGRAGNSSVQSDSRRFYLSQTIVTLFSPPPSRPVRMYGRSDNGGASSRKAYMREGQVK
jgi:hypothetical protein